jgi:hypothetical protein
MVLKSYYLWGELDGLHNMAEVSFSLGWHSLLAATSCPPTSRAYTQPILKEPKGFPAVWDFGEDSSLRDMTEWLYIFFSKEINCFQRKQHSFTLKRESGLQKRKRKNIWEKVNPTANHCFLKWSRHCNQLGGQGNFVKQYCWLFSTCLEPLVSEENLRMELVSAGLHSQEEQRMNAEKNAFW